MKTKFLLTGLLVSLLNLVLHMLAYFFLLKKINEAYPPGPEDYVRQLTRPPEELIVWGMIATSLLMGYFITLMMQWSGARTFISGLKKAFLMGVLFWGSVNFGLYASSHYFSLEGVFADVVSSAGIMTFAGAFAAWMLGRGNTVRK